MPKVGVGVVDKMWENCGMGWKAVGKTKVWVKLANVIHGESGRYTQVMRRGVDEFQPL
jgi:hypothetical protein